MLIGSLAIVGFGAGIDQLRQKNYRLGLWATSICTAAFIFNLVI